MSIALIWLCTFVSISKLVMFYDLTKLHKLLTKINMYVYHVKRIHGRQCHWMINNNVYVTLQKFTQRKHRTNNVIYGINVR